MKTFVSHTVKVFRISLFLILTAVIFQVASVSAQKADQDAGLIWQPVLEEGISARGQRHLMPEKYRTFSLNQTELAKVLDAAPLEFSGESRDNTIILTVPKPDGSIVRFRLEESSILSPEVAKQYPTWKTFQGFGIDDPTVTARFSWTDNGFHGYVLD